MPCAAFSTSPVAATPFFPAAEDEIAFRKVAEPFGWLGNISPHRVTYQERNYRTSEAIFQCMRLEEADARGRRGSNLFWDAVRVPDAPMGYAWESQNMLGLQWVELRAELRANAN